MSIKLTWPKKPDKIPANGGTFHIGVMCDVADRIILSGENVITPSFVDAKAGELSVVTVHIPANGGTARTIRLICGSEMIDAEQEGKARRNAAPVRSEEKTKVTETIPGISTYGVTGKAGAAGKAGADYSADIDTMYSAADLRKKLGLTSTSYKNKIDGWAVDIWKYRSGALTSITFNAGTNDRWTTSDVVMARNLSTKELLILN